MKIIEKPWGQEEILEINNSYVVKRLTMKAGHKCSLQYHENKLETIYVLSGKLIIWLEGMKSEKQLIITPIEFSPGDVITIPTYTKHRMEAKEEDSIYLECSTPELDDVVKLHDDYGRSGKGNDLAADERIHHSIRKQSVDYSKQN